MVKTSVISRGLISYFPDDPNAKMYASENRKRQDRLRKLKKLKRNTKARQLNAALVEYLLPNLQNKPTAVENSGLMLLV